MPKSILLFTLNDCVYCNSLKKKLKSLSIDFKEIDVNQHENIWDDVVKDVGLDYVPLTLIFNDENDDFGIYIVPGKDYETEDELIEIIRKNI